MIRILVLFAVLLAASGCGGGSAPGSSTKDARTTAIDEAGAIDIATRAVADNEGWTESVTYEALPAGFGWTVTATHADGSAAVIMIDAEGKVINYQTG